MNPKRVRCPQCGATTEYDVANTSRPFCSERCKLIDLGAWAEERYSIAGAATSADTDDLLTGKEHDDSTGANLLSRASSRRLNS